MRNKMAVFFFGPPGSGKGTQANLLVATRGFWHFDSGKFIERTVHNQQLQDDEIIQRERVIFESGALNTPAWILKIVREEAERVLSSNNITFSGSMRTLFEAVGNSENPGILGSLAKISKLYFFWLDVSDEVATKRNCDRVICSICATPLMHLDNLEYLACPLCGAALRKRSLDTADMMQKRLVEYRNRTVPVIDYVEESGWVVHKINGEKMPCEVHKEVLEVIS